MQAAAEEGGKYLLIKCNHYDESHLKTWENTRYLDLQLILSGKIESLFVLEQGMSYKKWLFRTHGAILSQTENGTQNFLAETPLLPCLSCSSQFPSILKKSFLLLSAPRQAMEQNLSSLDCKNNKQNNMESNRYRLINFIANIAAFASSLPVQGILCQCCPCHRAFVSVQPLLLLNSHQKGFSSSHEGMNLFRYNLSEQQARSDCRGREIDIIERQLRP